MQFIYPNRRSRGYGNLVGSAILARYEGRDFETALMELHWRPL
jgi:hypothetical protein